MINSIYDSIQILLDNLYKSRGYKWCQFLNISFFVTGHSTGTCIKYKIKLNIKGLLYSMWATICTIYTIVMFKGNMRRKCMTNRITN